MSAVTVARKELMEHVRTKRLLIVGGIFLATLLLGIWLSSLILRDLSPEDRGLGLHKSVLILGFYFGLFPLLNGINFTSVLGIVLSADAIVGEWKDRTLMLVLSKPISRSGLVLGKFAGALAAVFSVYSIVFAIGVAAVFSMAGVPNASNIGNMLGAFALMFVGLIPYVAMALCFSVLLRSPAMSFILSLAMWFMVLPLAGNIGRFIRIRERGIFGVIGDDAVVRGWKHLDPGFLMQEGSRFLLGGRSPSIFGAGNAKVDVGLLLLAAALHIVVWMGLALWTVNRRDYA